MSVQPILEELKKTTVVNESLLRTSQAKTECLKKGDMDQLQKLLLEERRTVQMISRLETDREKLVGEWALAHGIHVADATISVILEHTYDDAERESLARQFEVLTEVLTSLKRQEELNRQLLEQSLDFIEISLGMIDPQVQQVGYSKPTQQNGRRQAGRPLFDSKA